MSKPEIRCGLEVHAQLNFLQSKLFCSCKIDLSSNVNENTCPICRGLPGSLPSVNGDAVTFGLRLAKALSMKPVEILKFSRKHYDYPDLPKGFQITQNYDGILGTEGFLPYKDEKFPIRQIQIEEDPAKLVYYHNKLVVDYNRSGICLIELVTDPIFTNQDQIKAFLTQYRRLLYYLKISDTRKESSFRADVNVSVGDHPRVEVKNVGADSDIIDAFLYEVSRQSTITDFSNIGMETRNWIPDKKKTEISRDKESNSDYKYMPEGNIPAIKIPQSYFKSLELTRLPWIIEEGLKREFSLDEEQLQFLLNNIDVLGLFKSSMAIQKVSETVRKRFFWQEFLSWYNVKDSDLSEDQIKRILKIDFQLVAKLLVKLESNTVTNQEFKKILKNYVLEGKSLEEAREVDDTIINSVLEYLKTKYPDFFVELPIPNNKINRLVGLGVKYSKGKVNPKMLQKMLSEL